MGAKVTFNELTKTIEIDEAPDVNGDVLINVKVDLYSDGKEDWVAAENLRKFYFPISAEGGKPLPGEKDLGSTFFLASDWKIRPYDANHRLIIDGNLYAVDGSDPFIDTVSNFPVRVMQQVSDLVSTVSSGSGLSSTEHDQLMSLPTLTNIESSVILAMKSDTNAIAALVLRALGLMQENYYMDQTSYTDYNGAKLLNSGRIRLYSVAGSVGTANNVLATYLITAVWSAGQLSTYQVVKQ
jgi:hypothetical protein